MLETLLGDGESATLWVDAICINQKDVQEKNKQVSLIKEIYQRAGQVVIFLGRRSEDSDTAMDFITPLEEAIRDLVQNNELISANSIIQKVRHSFPGPAWTALSMLLNRPWFNRVWVIQEVSVGRNPLLICGGRAVKWDSIAYMALMLSAHDVLFRVYEDDVNRLQLLPQGLINLGTMYEARCVQQEQESEMLQEILLGLYHFDATVSHDKIYALLGLAVDAADAELQPDYGASIEDVYTKTARYLLLRDPSILILHMAGIGRQRNLTKMPSWVPDWSRSKAMCFGSMVRTAGYRAASDTLPRVRPTSTLDTILFGGVIVDTIEEVGHARARAASEGNEEADAEFRRTSSTWLHEAEALARSLSPNSKQEFWKSAPYPRLSQSQGSLYEAFWRTLIANMCLGVEGHTLKPGPVPPSVGAYYTSYRRNILLLDGGPSSADPVESTRGLLYHKAHINATEGRRFFNTKGGFIGLGNEGVKLGDEVAILAGGVTPFILRRDMTTAARRDHFSLVGEAYIHGLMDGEGLRIGEIKQIALF
jgi:hypothetical protein